MAIIYRKELLRVSKDSGMKIKLVILLSILLILSAISVHGEEWMEIDSSTLQVTFNNKIYKTYSETYFDKDGIKEYKNGTYKFWTKSITYNDPKLITSGSPEVETRKTLYIINCSTMTFDTLVGGISDPIIDNIVKTNVVSGSTLKYNIVKDTIPEKMVTILCQ